MIAVVALLAGASPNLAAQQSPPEPEPYDPAEFAPILHDLRRAEIVSVGVFPIALLFTAMVYDYVVWAGEGFDPDRVPLVRRWDVDPYDTGEKVGIALAAVGVALGVAIVDQILAAEERRSHDRSAARSP